MKKYIKLIKPYIPAFLLAAVLTLAEVAGEIALPRIAGLMIDYGIGSQLIAGRGRAYIGACALVMIGIDAVMFAGGIAGRYFAVKGSSGFSLDLRNTVFDKIQTFSFRNIDKFSTGSIITRLTADINNITNFLLMALLLPIRTVGAVIGGIVMAFSINTRLALILLAVILLLIIVMAVLMRLAVMAFASAQKNVDAMNTNVQENILNMQFVKAFMRGGCETDRFNATNSRLRESAYNASKLMAYLMPAVTAAVSMATLAVLWNGGTGVIVGGMKVGELSALLMYTAQILTSLMTVSMAMMNLSRALTSFFRVSELLNTENEPAQGDAGGKATRGAVGLKNVFFKYYKDNTEYVLKDICLNISPGMTVGIIGVTGSGKSTLVKLISGLYKTDKGEVLIDGINVRDYSAERLRSGVITVLQNDALFSGTIEDNIRFGCNEAGIDEIRSAAALARAEEFINAQPMGYHSRLERGGSNLSGGQKQRLAIARAILKKPKVLILDDCTGAVDIETERLLLDGISNGLKDTTKIIVSQRISSIINADMIIVMKEGSIESCGTHDELMKTDGEYLKIYNSQYFTMREVSDSGKE